MKKGSHKHSSLGLFCEPIVVMLLKSRKSLLLQFNPGQSLFLLDYKAISDKLFCSKQLFLRIWSHLLKKSLTENFIFGAVILRNAPIVYYLLFWNLSRNSIGYGYYSFHLWQFWFNRNLIFFISTKIIKRIYFGM